MSSSLQPHGLCPTGLLCPWASPGKNTGVHPLIYNISWAFLFHNFDDFSLIVLLNSLQIAFHMCLPNKYFQINKWRKFPGNSVCRVHFQCQGCEFDPFLGFPGVSDGAESAYNAGDGFDPWVWKIPWGREWLATPVFLPGEFHKQRRLAGYSPWGHKEWDTTERLSFLHWLGNLDHTNLMVWTATVLRAGDAWRGPRPRGTLGAHTVGTFWAQPLWGGRTLLLPDVGPAAEEPAPPVITRGTRGGPGLRLPLLAPGPLTPLIWS